MAELTASQPIPVPSFRALVRRHSLVSYFVVTFVGSWLLMIPLVLSQRGLNLIAIPDAAGLLVFILTPYAGPLLAAFLITGVVSGKVGTRQLLRRMVQWRVGLRWYLLVLLGYPLIYVIGFTPSLGGAPLSGLLQNWPLLFTVYIPAILVSVLIDGIAEETGWRGFALPRLQLSYGPIPGSLILGGLLAIWHLPAYFIPGAILPGAFDPIVFVANSVTILLATIVWTWLFNGAKGSVFFAILIHATSNGASQVVPQLFSAPDDAWTTPFIFAVCALLVILLTRGRLGYARSERLRLVEAR